jgi:hypothetical protein
MDRNLLSTIPVGVSAGLEDGGLPAWGLLGSAILSETATGTHGPGALQNDGLTSGLRYVPVLLSRSAAAFVLYPNGSYEGPNPSSAEYNLYEEGTGIVPGSPGSIVIAATVPPPPAPPPIPPGFEVVRTLPVLAIRKSGERLTVRCDDEGVPYEVVRASGAVIRVRMLSNVLAYRAVTDDGELLTLV